MNSAEFKNTTPVGNSAPTLSFDTARSYGGEREQQRQDSITGPSLTLFPLHPVQSLLYNLQRGMVDSEAILQQLLQAPQHCITIRSNRGHHMGTQGVEAGSNVPNVKIVNPFHPNHAGHRLSDLPGVQVGRHSFHEHMHGLREE